MPELAYVNGEVMPIDQAYVPVEDRGYQFGDAAYEFLASYNGSIFAMDAHLDRLERSLSALAFEPIDRDLVRNAIATTFEQAGYARAGIYVQVSRGVAPRNHAFPAGTPPQIVITVRPVPQVAETLLQNGANAITVTDIRWDRCDIKTVQLLPNALAKQQALNAGANDAIFVSKEGIVREGTASNLFIATPDGLLTHPLTPNILPGITRAVLIDLCRNQGISVQEAFFDQDALLRANEVFLTGTVTEVLPVSRVNGQAIADGKPGPWSRKLLEMLRQAAGA